MSKQERLARIATQDRAEQELASALNHLLAAATVLEGFDPILNEATRCAVAQVSELQKQVTEAA